MGIVNWLKKRSKIEKTGYVIFALVFLMSAVWVVIFAYAAIDVSPNRYQILNNASPDIRVDWAFALGATLDKAKVTLDGKEITKQIKLLPRGFTYKTTKDLNEGEHLVEADLNYGFLFPKKIKIQWNFTTDTVPPEVEFEEAGASILATSEPNMVLNGLSEPFSGLEFILNGKSIFGSQVGEDGKFSVSLSNLKKKNTLKVRAIDKANNVTEIKLPLVLDKTPSKIVSFTPAPNSTINGTDVKFAFRLSEKESEIGNVSVKLDDKDINVEFDKDENKIKKEVQLFEDGVHIVLLTVKDAAGNTSRKKWKFRLDTTKVVVDKSETTLYVYKRGKVIRTFRVAVGQPAWPTPAGHWKIVNKVSMPSWSNPGTSWAKSMPPSIPPGPGNPLGLRALYLDASGIRIHGTNNIGSIGSPASHGCIRVANSEIVQLYPLVNIGSPVDIVD